MKNTRYLLFCLLAVPFVVLAQTNVPPVTTPPGAVPGSGMGLLLTLIPLVVPMLVAAAKTAFSNLPPVFLPILATILGAVLNYILVLTNQPHTNLLVAAILGASGIGVRELYDQIKGTIQTQAPPPSNPTPEPPKA